jgi:hypothetical protein
MRSKVLIVVLAALALFAGAWLLTGERRSPPAESIAGGRLFPELERVLNDIDRIRVEHSGSAYEVLRKDRRWQLPDKGDYLVLFERVKPLLLGIALLEKVEPKTDKPQNYARLGVQQPSADSGNMRISLYAGDRGLVASLIVGKIRQGLMTGGRDGLYVRVPGESRAWLVAGNLDLPQAQADWVDRQIVHIKPKTVRRVTIKHPDGESLVLEKPRQGAPEFAVVNLPEDAVVKAGVDINALARSLAGLDMEDVLVRSQAAFPASQAVSAVFETWDGLQVTAYTIEQGEKIVAWFDVGVAALDVTDLSNVRTTQSDAAGLRSRLQGWVFQIPQDRGRRLRARLDELVQPSGTSGP